MVVNGMAAEKIAIESNTREIIALKGEVAEMGKLTTQISNLNVRLEGELVHKRDAARDIEKMTRAIAALDITLGRVDERLKGIERRQL
jgi:uncharacterized sporulation protein YeaH/YhbH (DUF444 family)